MEVGPFACGLAAAAPIQRICVFCGARLGTDPIFAAVAEELGRAAAHAGLGVVYGGGGSGLMGIVAHAALRAGGAVTGVIPRFLIEREEALLEAHELIVVEDMATRKREMALRADAFIALPGGLGTLEEIAEQMSWSKLGRHEKPMVLVDVANYWAPLITALQHMTKSGFAAANDFAALSVVPDAAGAIAKLIGPLPRDRSNTPAWRSRAPPLLKEIPSQRSQHDIYYAPDHING
jgi:uncharacterized protein (TIGR00730 family)